MAGQENAFFALGERLSAGETLIGTFIQVPHMVVADFLARTAGLDFDGLQSHPGLECR